jgi:hypothetical protein
MIDLAKIAAGATVSTEAELPTTTTPKRTLDLAPFIELVGKAKKDGKRYDLPGRYSLKPYDGKKAACEAYTVISHLHAAARRAGVKLNVRRVDPTATDTGITFKVAHK